MSGSFVLVLTQPPLVVQEAAVASLLAPLTHPGAALSIIHSADEIGIGVVGTLGTRGGTAYATIGPNRELAVVMLGQLGEVPSLRHRLKDRLDPHRVASDAELIGFAYLTWGDACVDRLIGDFAFALYDRRAGRLFAAVDAMGVHRLFYRDVPGLGLVLTTSEACILAGMTRPLAWDAVALAFWLNATPDRGRSLFQGIETLACGHRLVAEADRRSVSSWWSPGALPTLRYRHVREYADHYRDLLDRSVGDRLRTTEGPVVCELSGGLDSTSVAASCVWCVRKHRVQVHAVSHLYPGFPAVDEADLIRATCEHLGIPGTDFNAAALMLDRYPLDFAPRAEAPGAYDHPLQQRVIQEAVQLGAHTIFTGHGGDELTTGGVRWWLASRLLQGDFRVLGQLDAIRRRCGASWSFVARIWLLAPLARSLLVHGQATARWWPACGRLPLPDWMDRRSDLAARFLQRRMDLSGAGKLPPAAQEILAAVRTSTSLGYLDAYRANALGSGVTIAAPLLDARMLAFALGTPPDLWYRDGWRKWLVRQAFQDRLPSAVCRKRTKVTFDEVAVRAWEHHRPRIDEVIRWTEQRRDRHWAIADVLSSCAGQSPAAAAGIHQEFALVLALWLKRND